MAGQKTPNFMTDYNKFLAQYNKYSPYLRFGQNLARGGNIAKSAAETQLDKMAGAVPVYGDIYKGVKLFNDVTGGVNFNKMLGIKNPLTQAWNGLWGVKKPKSPEEQAAEDPEYAKYMGMLSDMQNSSAAAERSALEKRAAIQPMQEKAVSDYMDILQNGLSSRQLAPVYAAGEARNRAIGAGAEAGLMQQVQNRGMGGGIQAGLEAAVQANRNAMSADLNSRITSQQIAARPGMLGQAANLTMGLENQAQQELAQAAMNRLNAANVGLQSYNAAQQNKRLERQIQFERDKARQAEMGALVGKFGPDVVKGIERLLKRGVKTPGSTEPTAPTSDYSLPEGSTPTEGNDTSGALTDAGRKVSEEPFNPFSLADESIGGPNGISALNDYTGVNMMPVDASTRVRLDIQFDPNGTLPVGTRKQLNGVNFFKTKSGWTKSYDQLPYFDVETNDLIGGINGVAYPNLGMGPGSVLTGGITNSGVQFQPFWNK
jgi:hypothetical protein